MTELTADIQGQPRTVKIARVSMQTLEASVAFVAIAAGVVAALRLLTRGMFFNEYFTLALTNPGQSAPQFIDMMKDSVHPVLHFLIVWAMRLFGVEDIAALRAANLLGVPVLAWALWFAVKNATLTRTQAWTIAALCASSTVFLDSVAETRSYFMLACASVALVLSWRVVAKRIADGGTLTAGLLASWGLPLAMLSNLHHFGMLFGGLLTLGLLYELLQARRRHDLLILAIVSVLAAAPALLIGAMQMGHGASEASNDATPQQALEICLRFLRAVVVNNLIVFALAVAAVFRMLASREERRETRATLILSVITIAFFVALFVINLLKPMMYERYLTPAIGPIIVVSTVLALDRNASRWASIGVSVCALLAVVMAIVTHKHTREGWDVSADKVAGMVAACHNTKVFVQSHRDGSLEDLLDSKGRVAGYLYWKNRYNLPITEVQPGAALPAGDACPNIFWHEHAFAEASQQLDAAGMLKRHGLTTSGKVSLEYISSGAIVTIGKPDAH